ncbi:NPCBM/NEW2 domain-containing protein [Propionicimonas paludicola]|uniref:NPCBM/NEW2 domain-containing protein n=1 Tax=Propionicimonas paludicola TaxID=185243 RepID=UPI00117B5866|nr:NPCBM/NEW2 domain-containing protein [Propionicimonas paludicola]
MFAIVVAVLVQAIGQTYASTGGSALPQVDSPAIPPQAGNRGSPAPSTPAEEPEPVPSSSPVENSAPVEDTDGPPEDEPTQAATSIEQPSGRYYLVNLRRIEEEKEGRVGSCTGGCTGFAPGPGHIGGSVFPRSYLMGVAGDGRRSRAVWNSVNSCSALDATVGLDDSSGAGQVTFTISRDGGPAEELATTSLGQRQLVSVPLDGVAQFELAAYVSGSPVPQGVKVVWGDAVIVCEPGSLDT